MSDQISLSEFFGIEPLQISPPIKKKKKKKKGDKVTLVQGTDATNEAAYVFAESGPFEIGNGDRIMHANQLITDTENLGDNGLRFKFKTQQTPEDTEAESAIYDIQSDGYTDIRVQGREVSLRVESPYDQDWDIGRVRMEVAQGGRR